MSDMTHAFTRAPAGAFALDPRFHALVGAGAIDGADDDDARPEPDHDGLPAATALRGFAASAPAAFVPLNFGDGRTAAPGAAILALLDAAAQAAGAPAPRGAPPADPLATARAEAYAQGWADAQAAAAAATARHEAELAAIRLGFVRLDAALSAQSAAWLAETVAALCEATLAPLALDAAGLAARAARAVDLLAEAEGTLTIRLNPADHAAVAALLPADWSFRPDATLARGVLAVAGSEGGVIDDPADWPATIRAAIARALPAPAAGPAA